MIVTQIDDGATDLTEKTASQAASFTSSSSAPSNIFEFLDLLEPYSGDRVLEIGTGTGWTAALLCVRFGSNNVTTVEVDEQIAKQAAATLDRAGYAPTVVVGDGTEGWPEGAPYDRLHVTCGVREIPYTWVEQTRPGGVIVAPWMPGVGGHKVRLTATGECAVGRFRGTCGYMMVRAQRRPGASLADDERESVARVDPRRVTRAGRGFEVALAGVAPGVTVAGSESADGSSMVVLSDLGPSHALVRRDGASRRTVVTQRGPRNLWDEAEETYLTWVGWGEPGIDRFGLTVTP
ncbi:methyltransferase domain-containing protein [Allosalinactinospora lopnorensis]|uniref:methyltransferase domain-containing protein n=1 Tax=Allosalinactinospora lopnorensis TaxID=1352348 RepID=UPI001F19FA7E|nr:methyltransferase domain-containing protein [Allosalinactinospora lopnorensis]